MTAPRSRSESLPLPESICVETSGRLLGIGNIKTEFRYDPAHPFTVTMAFPNEHEVDGDVVTWSFGRDLLDAGIKDWAGQGDVRIWPTDTSTVHIKIQSPEGEALFEFDKKVLREFVRAIYKQVPRNKETRHLDVDAEIQRLLR